MATNAERIDDATIALEAATVKAEEASQVMDDFTRFDETQDVTNQDGEMFPSLAKWLLLRQAEVDAIVAGVLASKQEAEEGIENTKTMTSFRTAQAIQFQVGSPGNKNKIAGGDFATNPMQRGESFAAVANNDYTADRWMYEKLGSSAVHTVSRVTGESDGRKALRVETTTADATVAAGDLVQILQPVEGFNIVPLVDGGAAFFTRIRSDVTGIIAFSFRNSGLDRSYVAEVDILLANTFQNVEIIIPPFDTGGTWNYIGGIGLEVGIVLMVGSTFQTTVDVWQTGNFSGTSNVVNRCASIGNHIEFDKVQLEKGAVRTDFEDLTIGNVRILCERYYQLQEVQLAGFSNIAGSVSQKYKFALKTTMRAPPSALAKAVFVSNNVTNIIFGVGAEVFQLQLQPVVAGLFDYDALIELNAELT